MDVKRLNISAKSNSVINFVIASRKTDFLRKIIGTQFAELIIQIFYYPLLNQESLKYSLKIPLISIQYYRRLLNREPDTNAFIFYCKQLLSGTSKKDIENFILVNDEYKSKNLI